MVLYSGTPSEARDFAKSQRITTAVTPDPNGDRMHKLSLRECPSLIIDGVTYGNGATITTKEVELIVGALKRP